MSAGCLSNASCQSTPYKMMNNDNSLKNSVEKQGIVSILCSDFNNSSNKISPSSPKNPSFSIRRTLSADMSSQKWLQNNGLPPQPNLKKVQSSQQLQALGEEVNFDHDDNKGPAFEDVWSSIQADKRSWGSILSSSNNEGSGSELGLAPPPYVHPLARRTASSLSEKSLEICTESLGSETGSDGFSYPPSEPEESEEEEHEQQQEEEKQQEEVEMKGNNNNNSNGEGSTYKYNNYNSRGPTSKRSMIMAPPVRPSFPPPLPSLAHRDGGSNLHIRSHRHDGRLVVEAVAVPSQNCLRAQRQDGRLLLTLANDNKQEHHHEDEVVDDDDMVLQGESDLEKEEEEEEEEEEETAVVKKEGHEEEEDEEEEDEEEFVIPRGVSNVQRSCKAFTMSKLMELTSTRNKSTWPRNYNTTVIKTLNDEEEEEEVDEEEAEMPVTQSLPPRPKVSTAAAAAVALNAYEYYWRRSNSPAAVASVAMLKPLVGHQNNNTCAPQVGKDTKGNNNNLLFAAHNRKAVALAQQEMVLVKAAGRGGGVNNTVEKAEYLVPLMLRGCKQHKRSLLFWEPYCIATS